MERILEKLMSDPVVTKSALMAMAGMIAVLFLAVIILAVKKNVYYIDKDGNEYTSKKKLMKALARGDNTSTAAYSEEDEEDEDVKIAPPVSNTGVFKSVPEEPVEEAVEEVEEVVEDEDPAFPEEPEDEEYEDEYEEDEEEEVIDAAATEEELPAGSAKGLLIQVDIKGEKDEYQIEDLPCTMGREASKCDLVLDEPAVSRLHAQFVEKDGKIFIEDLSEHNGTYVNRKKLDSLGMQELHDGDVINLGRAVITVEKVL